MNKSFLEHYERELHHLRTTAAVFARENERVARGLMLDAVPCPDPYVERLLDGVAFLAARVQQRIEAGYPKFIETLFNSIYPHYLPPTPSMTIVQFQVPDGNADAFRDGRTIPRETELRTTPFTEYGGRCTFRTAHEVRVWPITVQSAAYFGRNMGMLRLADALGSGESIRSCIRLELTCAQGINWSQLPIPQLDFFLGSGTEAATRLYEHLLTSRHGYLVRWEGKHGYEHVWNRQIQSVDPLGFAAEEAMLPSDARSFHGYRLLHEYFAFPARFMFSRFSGLASALSRTEAGKPSRIEIIVPLAREDDLLEERPNLLPHFKLGCTPAINLFQPESIDPVAITASRHEYKVIPDAARQMDFEVYRIDEVSGPDRQTGAQRTFAPFYASGDPRRSSGVLGGYFTTHRRFTARSEFEVESGRRSQYMGSDVFLSLTDANGGTAMPDVTHLVVQGLCTNRDLPLNLWEVRGEAAFDGGKAISQCKVRCLMMPTMPMPAIAHGESAWRLVSHLGLNYFPLWGGSEDGQASATSLRDLCRLFAERDAPEEGEGRVRSAPSARQVDSIKELIVRRVSGPLPREDRLSIVRGLEVELTLDERPFQGASPMLFASVLEQFFARYVSINSFINFVLRTQQRGEVHRWQSRLGRRPTL
jgi:type VI secretion system protein ImpG